MHANTCPRIVVDNYSATTKAVVKRRKVANLLALAVLSLLRPGYPMHPYQIANVLRRTGKEHDMPIKVGSLYTVVRNLERHGFIEAIGSHRAGRRPERTEYAITDTGRAELADWLRELVAVPESEIRDSRRRCRS